jgi:hypothetical protein
MAKNWGVTVNASDMATVRDTSDFSAVIGAALANR